MSRHDDKVYLRQMLGHAQTAISLAGGRRREDLDTDLALRYALLHLICIMGEAGNRVSVETKLKYADIPWRDIVSMRNKLIHGYDVVDLDMLWKTVTDDIPRTEIALLGAIDAF